MNRQHLLALKTFKSILNYFLKKYVCNKVANYLSSEVLYRKRDPIFGTLRFASQIDREPNFQARDVKRQVSRISGEASSSEGNAVDSFSPLPRNVYV